MEAGKSNLFFILLDFLSPTSTKIFLSDNQGGKMKETTKKTQYDMSIGVEST